MGFEKEKARPNPTTQRNLLRRSVALLVVAAMVLHGPVLDPTRAGSIVFEPSFSGTENPSVGVVGDPVSTTGEYSFEIPLFRMTTGPIPIDLRFIHASYQALAQVPGFFPIPSLSTISPPTAITSSCSLRPTIPTSSASSWPANR